MPNPNSPYGLIPVRRKDGGAMGRVAEYKAASGLAANIGIGSLVKRTGTGRNITAAANTDTVVGVCAGFQYRNAQGDTLFTNYWATGTVTFNAEDVTVYVWDDPQLIFKVRASAALAATDEGQFAGVVVTAPNALTGRSATALDSADITGTLDNLKILNLLPEPGNDYGSFAQAEVFIAKHEYRDAISAT